MSTQLKSYKDITLNQFCAKPGELGYQITWSSGGGILNWEHFDNLEDATMFMELLKKRRK